LFQLGWPKAYQILRVAKTPEEIQKWYVQAQNLSEVELTRTVKLALQEPKTRDAEYENKVLQGQLVDPIALQVKFRRSEHYSFFKKAEGMIAKRHGGKDPGAGLSLLAARHSTSTLPGHGDEVPSEISLKIQAIEESYGIKLAVVRDAEVEVEEVSEVAV